MNLSDNDTDNSNNVTKRADKVVIFFFGFIFVLILGKHYFANLAGTPEEKSELLKYYYFGLVFWIALSIGIYFLTE